jgi:aconitate hydratase
MTAQTHPLHDVEGGYTLLLQEQQQMSIYEAAMAESFERIHRANLAGMGVLPLQFLPGTSRKTLQLNGTELISVRGLQALRPGMHVQMEILDSLGARHECELLCRLDTEDDVACFTRGGILPFVLEQMLFPFSGNPG